MKRLLLLCLMLMGFALSAGSGELDRVSPAVWVRGFGALVRKDAIRLAPIEERPQERVAALSDLDAALLAALSYDMGDGRFYRTVTVGGVTYMFVYGAHSRGEGDLYKGSSIYPERNSYLGRYVVQSGRGSVSPSVRAPIIQRTPVVQRPASVSSRKNVTIGGACISDDRKEYNSLARPNRGILKTP